MSWECDVDIGEVARTHCRGEDDPITASKISDGVIVSCGPQGKDVEQTCYDKSTLIRMSQEGQLRDMDPMRRGKFSGDAKRKLSSLGATSSGSWTASYDATPSFFSPSRRLDMNLARSTLLDELRNYQPRRNIT